MTTVHWGLEEMIARQHEESRQRATRHTWHLTEFWRHGRRPEQPVAHQSKRSAKMNELVELGITQARWAMV